MPRSRLVPSIYKKITLFFIFVSIILIAIIVFFETDKAKIQIHVASQRRDINFAVPVSEEPQIDSLTGRILETGISKSRTFQTPKSIVTDSRASGQVTLINNYSADQPLIATTRLLTPNSLLFRLTETVTIPAGGQIQAEVRADEAGDEYLIGPTSFTIPGLWEGLQDKIYAESSQAMSYQTIETMELTDEIYQESKAELLSSLTEDVYNEFLNQLDEGETVKLDALAVTITEEKSSAKIGSQDTQFSISLTAKVKTLAFNEEELKKFIINQLMATVDEGDKIIYNQPSLTLSIELYPDDQDNIAVITGQYQVNILNANINYSDIYGLNKKEAEAYLKKLPNVENADISFWPFWVTKIPNDSDKIEIVIN